MDSERKSEESRRKKPLINRPGRIQGRERVARRVVGSKKTEINNEITSMPM